MVELERIIKKDTANGDKAELVFISTEWDQAEMIWPICQRIIKQFGLDFLWIQEEPIIEEWWRGISIIDVLKNANKPEYVLTKLEKSNETDVYGDKIVLIKNPPESLLAETFTSNWAAISDCAIFKLEDDNISISELSKQFDRKHGFCYHNKEVINLTDIAIMNIEDNDGIIIFCKTEFADVIDRIIRQACTDMNVKLIIKDKTT